MRFAGFFMVVALLLGGAALYLHRRTSRAFRLERRGRRALGAVLIAGIPAMLMGRLIAGVLPEAVGPWFGLVGSIIALGTLIGAIVLLFLDGGLGLVKLVRSATPSPPEEPAAPVEEAATLDRRDFLGRAAAGSALLVGASSSLYGVLVGRHDYVIEEVVVRIPGLARALEGFTLVQISDLHLGQFVGEPELAAADSLIRRARPDALVLTGDLIDHDLAFTPMLGRFLRRLDGVARAGIFAIPGNHDHYAGVEETLATVEQAGAKVLLNAGHSIGGAFALLGVDDVWGSRRDEGPGPDLARAIASVPPDLPRVLLAHNPVFFPRAAPEVALQLSGHTHGGQVNLLVRPADLLLPYGYVAGLYERGGSRLYVNRGFGTAGPPARIGSAPEVTRIVLVAG